MHRMVIAALLGLLPALAPAAAGPRGDAWWAHVEALAADGMKGRATGSADYLRTADYVIGRFKTLGLEPAGTDGFFQPVALVEQTVAQGRSKAELVGRDGRRRRLSVPGELIVSGRGGPVPAMIDAPLVFAGYGLHVPEAGYDDFKGLDVRGRIVVVLSGGPADISGPLKSSARLMRARLLAERGAAGILTLTTVKQVEIPWERQVILAAQPAMFLADPALRDVANLPPSFAMDSLKSEALFEGSGHSFAELSELADASRPLPTFTLPLSLKATISARRRDVTSPNLVARLPGGDPKLKDEYVVVSAHLDHLGVGEPIGGDRIYNGAMDNASGVASVLEIAARLKAEGATPKRSILFAMMTAEEKGLLGSRYFTERPPVPRQAIVADLNFDMPLPIFPLRSVIVLGAEESSLGADAHAVGIARGLPLVPDPLPDRNSFVRSDQYSFIRTGIPAVAFKFGFVRDTPEFKIEHDWRATRYHAPSDDLDQPVMKDEAVKLDDFVADLALRVANDPARPSWNVMSSFRQAAGK